jgi:hypothetical protein
MSEKLAQLNIERQMADLEKSIDGLTKHERKMIRAALDLFSGTLEFISPAIKNTTHDQPELNIGLLSELKGVERII